MTPEQSTEELSDFELTQRLRAARGQAPLPDPDSLEAKLRAGAASMLEDHRNHGLEDHRIRGIDYERIDIDDPTDPIPLPIPAPFDGSDIAFPGVVDYRKPIAYPRTYTGGTIKIGDGPTVKLDDLRIDVPENGTDLRFTNTCDNAIALAGGGTTTGRLKWTGKK